MNENLKSKLEDLISAKTKLFMLNSPNNPSGKYFDSTLLKKLGDILQKHKNRAEFWQIIRGNCIVTVGAENYNLEDNDNIYIPKDLNVSGYEFGINIFF